MNVYSVASVDQGTRLTWGIIRFYQYRYNRHRNSNRNR